VPLGLTAGVLLLLRRPAGYLAAAIMLVNGLCMGGGLAAMVLADALASSGSPAAAAPFALVPLAAGALALALLRALHQPFAARPNSRRPPLGAILARAHR
jgi:enoyl-CoA hydratase/carnithine racemase